VTRFRLILLGIVATILGATALAAFAAPNPSTGPGNNGTVKLDLIPIDDTTPGNQPHVGCPFGVDWYGFDANARTSVEFRIWDPSTGTEGRQLLTANVTDPSSGAFLGQTSNDTFNLDADGPAGGGSQAGWDGSRSYDLTPGLLQYGQYAAGHGTGHPARLDGMPENDGYHVKVTIRTQTSHGADVKHKVFWTGLCDGGGSDGGGGGGDDGFTDALAGAGGDTAGVTND
jgi:hypothetical protein